MNDTEFYIDLPEDLFDTKLPNAYQVKYYQDLVNRTIWINEEINGDLTHELIHYITKWNREDKGIPEEDRKPIRLLFDSPGGELDAQAAICSVIELSETPVIGIAIGMVASAASYIYLSCHVRMALKSSYFILHKGSAQLNGDFDNIMNSIDDYKKEIDKLINFIIERSNYTRTEVEEHINKDWYIRAPEAVEKGVVDEIISNINVLL